MGWIPPSIETVSDLVPLIVFLGIVIACYLVFVVFPDHQYEITPTSLRMEYRVLKRVRLSKREIRFEDIKDVRRLGFLIPPGVWAYGNVFKPRSGVLLILRRRLLFWRRVFITPADPDAFVSELRRRLGLAGAAADSRKPLPLWATDSCGAAFVVGMAMLYAGPRSAAMQYPSKHVLEFILILAALAAMLLFCLWMWGDSLTQWDEQKRARFAAWAATIILCFPTALLYYVIESRPRRRTQLAASRRAPHIDR